MDLNPIDIVIPWVDGNDPEWQQDRDRYCADEGENRSVIRYRDWGLMPYWFRAIERFAPWVRTVHLVTWGHLPPWLKVDHPKLHVVFHRDYLPEDALPTFNSNAIELNMHRIEGLSEQFIYFNDDMFLIKPHQPEDFFQNGMPCDDAILSPVMPVYGEEISRISLNNMFVINKHFPKQETITAHRSKFLNPKYGKQLLRTLCLLPWRHFPGFFNDHLPQAFLKSTFETVWQQENELLSQVTRNRLRDYHHDVNQWLMRYWQLCQGKFVPVSPGRGLVYHVSDADVEQTIRNQRTGMVCLNDSDVDDFERLQKKLEEAFQAILPEKSTFEI